MFHLTVFGRFELTDAEGRDRLGAITQPKRLALLLFLAVDRPARWHRRDALTTLFWPELDQVNARSALRQAVHYLRHQLSAEILRTRGPEEIGLDFDLVTSDLADFEAAIAATDVHRALGLARGPLVPGFHCPSASPEFMAWLDRRRREVRRQAARGAGAPDAPGVDLAAAVEQLRQAIDQGSFDEGLVRQLMLALYREDNRAGALGLYELFAERLRRGLEIDPSPRTMELSETIRRGEA